MNGPMNLASWLPLPDEPFTLIWEMLLSIVVVAVVLFTSAASRAGDRELGQFIAKINQQARSVAHLSCTELAARFVAASNTSVSGADLVGPGVRLDGDTVVYVSLYQGAPAPWKFISNEDGEFRYVISHEQFVELLANLQDTS